MVLLITRLSRAAQQTGPVKRKFGIARCTITRHGGIVLTFHSKSLPLPREKDAPPSATLFYLQLDEGDWDVILFTSPTPTTNKESREERPEQLVVPNKAPLRPPSLRGETFVL